MSPMPFDISTYRAPLNLSMIPHGQELLVHHFQRMNTRVEVEDFHAVFDAEYLVDLMASAPSGVNAYVDLYCSQADRCIFNVTVPLFAYMDTDDEGEEVLVEDGHTTLSTQVVLVPVEDKETGFEICVPEHTRRSEAHLRRLTKGLLNHSTVMRSEPLFWLGAIMAILDRVKEANGGESIEELLGLRKGLTMKPGDCFDFILPLS